MADVMFQHLTRKVFVQMFNDSKSLLVITYVEQCCKFSWCFGTSNAIRIACAIGAALFCELVVRWTILKFEVQGGGAF